MSHPAKEDCVLKKERRLQESSVDDQMKREGEINEYLNRLERWRKAIELNISLKDIQASALQKIHERQIKTINEEVKKGSRALLMIRQAAMKALVQAELEQYKEELRVMGKCFYQERI